MRFDILTIFPKAFDSYLDVSILARAVRNKKISIHTHDIRGFTTDKHRSVDDKPYGGGVGMIMKVEPIHRALQSVPRKRKQTVILFSAKGKRMTQADIRRWSKMDQLVLVCPRYEGVDERVMNYVDEEISIGDYVLTGGELPAMIVVDAVARLLPGVLGKDESSKDESHSEPGILEYPQYTRPEVYKKKRVPKILLSGDHRMIQQWREKKKRRK